MHRQTGGREDRVPRHGMTARGPADLAAPEQAPRRRRGLSRWPIRRKLVALVAIPLFVILAGGAVVTTEAVRDLRAAQTADTVTTAASQSNQLAQQLQRELVATLSALNNNDAIGPRIGVRREWNASDAAYATLQRGASSLGF